MHAGPAGAGGREFRHGGLAGAQPGAVQPWHAHVRAGVEPWPAQVLASGKPGSRYRWELALVAVHAQCMPMRPAVLEIGVNAGKSSAQGIF